MKASNKEIAELIVDSIVEDRHIPVDKFVDKLVANLDEITKMATWLMNEELDN